MRSRQLWGPLLCLAIGVSGCSKSPTPTLTIATASNMQYALADLTQAFRTSTGIPCTPVFSSSGKLTAQIKGGAPYDVFLSADIKYPNALFHAGLTQEKPQVYAYGKLVLWTMKPNLEPSLDILSSDRVKHIGIANPKIAPYGRAAIESLGMLKTDPQIKQKLIYGENIAQVNQFISTQVVEVGFTAKSVVLSSPLAHQGQWIELDPTHYAPLAQGMALIKNDRGLSSQAQAFQAFMFSKAGQSILQNHGYTVTQP